MKIGSLFHTMVLEPEKSNFVAGPDVNKNTKEWKAFKADAEASGQTIIDQATLDMLNGMVASVRAHPAANALLSGPGIAEGSCFWHDERSGELCRCRPDKYRQDLGIIVDLKSTEDASPKEFARSIANYRYHMQSAYYQDGVEAATGDFIKGFVFVAVEKKAPYAVAVYQLDMQGVEAGRITYQRL
jgi:exodeoxyribonuclease VIII